MYFWHFKFLFCDKNGNIHSKIPARFLEAISFSHGAVLNVSNVARDCGVGRKTVEGFIQILYDIMLAFQIPVFTKRASRQMSAHPKFYFFDTGVFQTLRLKPNASLALAIEI